MHSALFVAVIPDLEKGNWDAFLAEIFSKLRTAKGVQRLAENVWLAEFASEPTSLAWLVASAERSHVAYRIFPFAEAPQWLPNGYLPIPRRPIMTTHTSPSKRTKRSPRLTDAERHKRFVETAEKVEASEDPGDFDRAFEKVVAKAAKGSYHTPPLASWASQNSW